MLPFLLSFPKVSFIRAGLLVQEVLLLSQQQPAWPELDAAFSRLTASLIAAAEGDDRLGGLASLWGLDGALLQLPWSGAFFPVILKRTKGKEAQGVSSAAASRQRLRVRLEFSDYGEAAAAWGCLFAPAEWRGGVTGRQMPWGEALKGEGNTSDISSGLKHTEMMWENARIQARRWAEAEALGAAAASLFFKGPPRWDRGRFVEKAIPPELLAALQLWQNGKHTERHRQPEPCATNPSDPLDFYGV